MAALPKNDPKKRKNNPNKPEISEKVFKVAIPPFAAIKKFPNVTEDELVVVMFFVNHFEKRSIIDSFENYQACNLSRKKNGVNYNAQPTQFGIRAFLNEFCGFGFLIDCFNENKMCVGLDEKGRPLFAFMQDNKILDAYFDGMMDQVALRVNDRMLRLNNVRLKKEEINQKWAEGKQDEQDKVNDDEPGIIGGAYYSDSEPGQDEGKVNDDEPGQVTETPQ